MNKLIKISSTLFIATLLMITHNVHATLQDEIGVVAGSAGNKIKEYQKNRDQVLFERVADVQHKMNAIRADLHDPKIEDERIAEIEAQFVELRAQFADILLVAEVKKDVLAEVARIDEVAQGLVKQVTSGDHGDLRDRVFEVKSSLSNLRQNIPGLGTTEELGDAQAKLEGYMKEVIDIQSVLGTSSNDNDDDDAPAAAAAASSDDT